MNTGVINGSPAVRGFAERLEALRGSAAFRNYQYARDRVLEMRAQARSSPHYHPSAYWEEELSNFEYMFDASPLIIDKLRHHTYHVTGLRVYDYRSHRDKAREQLAAKLRALTAQGAPELLVPEWREMGGFGFDIDGRLFNIDTLKFFEALIALEKGAVLPEFRNASERRMVWEIGAGWGGFPYQFKTLCPNVTYLITDLPELFVFSATYLMTAFPQAKVCFWGEQPAERIFANWREYDFIFTPNTALAELKPERLDLAVNMVSFQEMTDDQVAGYVERAHALECPFLYSLNRDKGSYNRQLESVSAILSRFYWPREIQVLPVAYTKMLGDAPSKNDYTHLLGWRRVKI
jgi:putative sugar O-methyltransferase